MLNVGQNIGENIKKQQVLKIRKSKIALKTMNMQKLANYNFVPKRNQAIRQFGLLSFIWILLWMFKRLTKKICICQNLVSINGHQTNIKTFLDELNWVKKNNLQSMSTDVSIINYYHTFIPVR